MSKRHAISMKKGDDYQITAEYISPYKKPCLVVFYPPNQHVKVASFGSHESATLFMEYLAEMVGADISEK